MVNYLYDLAAVERNHEAFANHGEIVASADVLRLRRTLETRPSGPANGSQTRAQRPIAKYSKP